MKLLLWLADRVPIMFMFGMAIISLLSESYDTMRFFITLGVLGFVLYELSEIKALVKKHVEKENQL